MPINTKLKALVPRRQAFKRTIVLPSGGYSNKKAWPDGNITVYPWDSAVDEFLINNSRKANGQLIIFDLIEKLCDLNGASIDDFVADETNIILLVARAISQNNEIKYTSTCAHCGSQAQECIRVPDELEVVGKKSSDYAGFDTIILPDCKDEVAIRPLQVKDERMVISRDQEKRAAISDNVLRNALRIVTIGQGSPTNLAELVGWLNAISPADYRYFEEQARLLSPHLNTVIEHTCNNPVCGKTFKHVLSFDQEFFR